MTETANTASATHSAIRASDLRVPTVAWPTIGLWLACIGLWTLSTIAAIGGAIPYAVAMLLNTVAAFAIFTPMHDASHRSVARARWINEVVGRIGVLPLVGPFTAFRHVHQEHHKHTNDEEKDPDHWSGRKPAFLLPLRWMTQDLYYYAVYLKNWKRRPVAERWETLATLIILYGSILILCVSGYTLQALVLWFVPSRIAQTLLAWTFDYLPHRPHTITAADDRFRASLILLHPVLTVVLLYQNYHLIHHLYPGVPFYRMASIWRSQRDYLIAQGAIVRH